MEHLLSAWPDIIQQLKNARHILLLTDYDGTLTNITQRPEEANLPDEIRILLRDLSLQNHLTVGVISGRELTNLQNKVRVNDIIYAGNHGLEIAGPGVNFSNHQAEEMKPQLYTIQQILTEALGKIKGVLIENKGLSLSIHYRMVEQNDVKRIADTIDNTIKNIDASGKIKVSVGKKVYEIKPDVDWNKGKAIKLIMGKYGRDGIKNVILPIYLGDDTTDEDGFNIIDNYQYGISVFVGEAKHNSTARYYLKSPAEVAVFLNMLLEQARRGFK